MEKVNYLTQSCYFSSNTADAFGCKRYLYFPSSVEYPDLKLINLMEAVPLGLLTMLEELSECGYLISIDFMHWQSAESTLEPFLQT